MRICCDLPVLLFGEIYADMSKGSASTVFDELAYRFSVFLRAGIWL